MHAVSQYTSADVNQPGQAGSCFDATIIKKSESAIAIAQMMAAHAGVTFHMSH